MTAVNLNRAIRGPVTAVPVVAGHGVRLVADTVNNRFVAEADETVLFYDSNGQSGSNNITLSESISNFEYVQIEFATWSSERYIQILPVQSAEYQLSSVWIDNSGNYYHFANAIAITGTTYSLKKAAFHNFNSTSVTKGGTAISNFKTYKVVGVNRIASN